MGAMVAKGASHKEPKRVQSECARVPHAHACGKLYIVPTPIGNLEDMTFRAVRILGSVQRILAEDTRHTRILCDHYGISTPLVSFHDHNTQERLPAIVAELQSGASLALVSDAGTPGVSDPGFPLVRAAVSCGVLVEALPGASAVLTALSGSGLASDRFLFEGFLPRTMAARRSRLSELALQSRTLLFYESPRRLLALLTDVASVMGAERAVVVARELTKIHETYHRGSAAALVAYFSATPPLGEVVVLIAGKDQEELRSETIASGQAERLLEAALATGVGVKEAARQVAAQTGVAKGELYRLALGLRGEED